MIVSADTIRNFRMKVDVALESHHSWVNIFLMTLVIANVSAFALATEPAVHDRYFTVILWFELVSLAIFSVEYVARIWAHPQPRWRFALEPMQIIDFLSIVPAAIALTVGHIDLGILFLLRLIRFIKIVRYSQGVGLLWAVIKQERSALFSSTLIMFGLAVVTATVMYFLERDAQPDKFGSVVQAMWWSFTTLGTIGYGDVVPVTVAGKIATCVMMIIGVGTFAIPFALIASGFTAQFSFTPSPVTVPIPVSVPANTLVNVRYADHVAEFARPNGESDGINLIHLEDPVIARVITDLLNGSAAVNFNETTKTWIITEEPNAIV